MGHYDSCYDEDDKRRKEQKFDDVSKRYMAAKKSIDELEKFCSYDGKLSNAFDVFKSQINNYLLKENILIMNPKVIIDKLSKND